MCKLCDTYDFRRIGYDFPEVHHGAAADIYFAGRGEIVSLVERFKFCPVCGKALTEEHFEPALFLRHEGRDDFDRPVYKSGGRYYVDTEPLSQDTPPSICTKSGNAFDGEPEDPVTGRFVFIPKRDTWH